MQLPHVGLFNPIKKHLPLYCSATLLLYCNLMFSKEYAYVTQFTDPIINVIDTSTNTITATINITSPAINIIITPNGKYAYLSSKF